MASATVYTKAFCPYCVRAIGLLRKKGVSITEIDAAGNAERRAEMLARSNGGRTYPQIFIGDVHVGGCDELHALDARGQLDPLLEQA